MNISILTQKDGWMENYCKILEKELEKKHNVSIVNKKSDLIGGDVCFLLGCYEIIGKNYLSLYKHNIVIHESDLPSGRGWSPMSWQILEGKNEIPISLFEANEKTDDGDIYFKDYISLQGNELVDEWQKILGNKKIEMCLKYINNIDKYFPKKQTGYISYYPKRTPSDCELNVNKSVAEQFNLFRIVDNERYPAFFNYKGREYILKIYIK